MKIGEEQEDRDEDGNGGGISVSLSKLSWLPPRLRVYRGEREGALIDRKSVV